MGSVLVEVEVRYVGMYVLLDPRILATFGKGPSEFEKSRSIPVFKDVVHPCSAIAML